MSDFNMEQCPVCETTAQITEWRNSSDNFQIDCPQCGKFVICSELMEDDLDGHLSRGHNSFTYQKDGPKNRLLLSHKIHRTDNKQMVWCQEDIDRILKNEEMPDIETRLDLVLMWIGNKAGGAPERRVRVTIPSLYAYACVNSYELRAFLNKLEESGLIGFSSRAGGDGILGNAHLTFDGWQSIIKLRHDRAS